MCVLGGGGGGGGGGQKEFQYTLCATIDGYCPYVSPHTTMPPCMPSQGLHPESHGIVNNYFYDTVLRDKFYIGVQNQNDPKWWLGEPVSKVDDKILKHMYKLICMAEHIHVHVPSRVKFNGLIP